MAEARGEDGGKREDAPQDGDTKKGSGTMHAESSNGASAANSMLKSAFEIAREQRIRENQAMLAKLGLLPKQLRMGTGRTSSKVKKPAASSAKKKRSKPKRSISAFPPRRKSRRLAKQVTVHVSLDDDEHAGSSTTNVEDDEVDYAELEAVRELERNARYTRLVEKHLEKGVKFPPNATYAHTYKRVRSMSKDAMRKRIDTIERARGTWAVVKMRMTAEVLILEDYPELANYARESLQRLLDLPKYAPFREAYKDDPDLDLDLDLTKSSSTAVETPTSGDHPPKIAHTMHASNTNGASTNASHYWMWKSDLEADNSERTAWTVYPKADSLELESLYKLHRKKKRSFEFNERYSVNFSHMIQHQTGDFDRQRPIKRVALSIRKPSMEKTAVQKDTASSVTKSKVESTCSSSQKEKCEKAIISLDNKEGKETFNNEPDNMLHKKLSKKTKKIVKRKGAIWRWKSNLEADDSDKNAWITYPEKEAIALEKAYKKKSKSVRLNRKYSADLSEMVQFQTNDEFRQRPIKREKITVAQTTTKSKISHPNSESLCENTVAKKSCAASTKKVSHESSSKSSFPKSVVKKENAAKISKLSNCSRNSFVTNKAEKRGQLEMKSTTSHDDNKPLVPKISDLAANDTRQSDAVAEETPPKQQSTILRNGPSIVMGGRKTKEKCVLKTGTAWWVVPTLEEMDAMDRAKEKAIAAGEI